MSSDLDIYVLSVSRFLMDYSDPVVKHWPEFQQNQKHLITVDQLLSHQVSKYFAFISYLCFLSSAIHTQNDLCIVIDYS